MLVEHTKNMTKLVQDVALLLVQDLAVLAANSRKVHRRCVLFESLKV